MYLKTAISLQIGFLSMLRELSEITRPIDVSVFKKLVSFPELPVSLCQRDLGTRKSKVAMDAFSFTPCCDSRM